jgi:pyruvate kinase
MAGIVATVGPATQKREKLLSLYENWVRILRINCSHATHEWMWELFSVARKVEKEISNTFAFLLDVKGPGIRTGELEEPITYEKDEKFKIVIDKDLVDDSKTMLVDYPFLIKDVALKWIIRVDSGLFDIKVIRKHKDHIIWQALNTATIWSKRHVNLPWVDVKLPWLTEKDKEDILFGIVHNISYVALSFARRAEDVQELREFLYRNNGSHLKIIAKIENQQWIDNISEIIRVSDAVMIARWDLWAELPIETIPSHQMNIIGKAKRKSKKVIVATQMLETMMNSRVPTRAEVSDVFYAWVQWADYLMLSGETSIWKYPIHCVQVMNKIIAESKKYI